MPVYNREKFLSDAIESILNQTITNFEFIIIDDGSTDHSVDTIKKYAEVDNRIKYLLNENNKGVGFSRNLGMAIAQGEYIAIMDSDDICLPTRFEKQLTFFEAHPEIDVLGSQELDIDTRGISLPSPKYPLTSGQVRWELMFGRSLCHPAMMMRKELLDKHHIYYTNNRVAEDLELLLRLSTVGKIANLPDTLLHVRKHELNVSSLKSTALQDEVYNAIRKSIKDMIGVSLSDETISGLVIARHLKKHKTVKDLHSASDVSHILVKLMQKAMEWNINSEDRFYIRQNTASRLRRIWKEQKYHSALLPYVVYSLILDPGLIHRRLQRLLPPRLSGKKPTN